tara:strand:- start:265 stop:456 length:192 start_codon:yes stop_codon:yes gene_type:complete
MQKTQQQQDFDTKLKTLKANAKKVKSLVAHYEELQTINTNWGFNGDLGRINELFNQIFNEDAE